MISANFGAQLDDELGTAPLSAPAAGAVSDAKEKPLAVPATDELTAAEAERVTSAAADASTSSFHLGIGIAGVLMIVGGIVAGIGIENPKRRVEAVPTRGTAAAGECGHSADCDCGERTGARARRKRP